jgi:hypothetical protein
VRRGLAKIDEAAGLTWLQTHLDYCVWPLLSNPPPRTVLRSVR